MNWQEKDIERWLDQALTDYARVEPRSGLESRIIAQLRTAPAPSRWRIPFAYALAAALTFCVISYGIWRAEQVMSVPLTQPKSVLAGGLPAPSAVKTNPHSATPRTAQRRFPYRVRGLETASSSGAKVPLPQPLSDQEKLLLAFARENPREVASTIAWQEEMRRPVEQEVSEGEQQ